MSGDIVGDTEENESLLFEEIVQENKKLYKCSICLRLLSRKQRIESHLQLVHGKGKLFPSSRISFDQSLLSYSKRNLWVLFCHSACRSF